MSLDVIQTFSHFYAIIILSIKFFINLTDIKDFIKGKVLKCAWFLSKKAFKPMVL